MNGSIGTRPPSWFRIVAVLALLWNCIGVWQYLSYVGTVPMMKEPTAAELEVISGAPVWFTAAFAIGVFGGLLGSLGLLLSKAWSRPLLLLSLVALIIQFGWFCFMSGMMDREGPAVLVMPAVVIAVAVLLVWLANTGVRRGWLT